jgi:Mlc titration factor MtfA (ptsG expression regulator)
MWNWLPHGLFSRRQRGDDIDEALWTATLKAYGFLASLTPAEQHFLRQLCGEFLAEKQFHGAQGLVITDAMALSVAAQACLPLLHLEPKAQPAKLLRWYDDFAGIVMHPDEVVAAREVADDFGIVHNYDEVLSGESMDQGPVMLNWHDVARSDATAAEGYNLVIHEFAHKLDLRDGQGNGCPPLPHGFLGTTSAAAARAAWLAVVQPAYDGFREQVIKAERFSGTAPWMDAYAAESTAEFFAVACEAYFVQRERFTQEFPPLRKLFDAFFDRPIF